MPRSPVLEIWGRMAADLEIERELEDLILDGSLYPGEELPSVRSVSVELMISPRAVERAYGELERRGLVMSDAGSLKVAALASDAAASQGTDTFSAALPETVSFPNEANQPIPAEKVSVPFQPTTARVSGDR